MDVLTPTQELQLFEVNIIPRTPSARTNRDVATRWTDEMLPVPSFLPDREKTATNAFESPPHKRVSRENLLESPHKHRLRGSLSAEPRGKDHLANQTSRGCP